LARVWDTIYETRKRTLKQIVEDANSASRELLLAVYFDQNGMDRGWERPLAQASSPTRFWTTH
jgi:hypothetical protein